MKTNYKIYLTTVASFALSVFTTLAVPITPLNITLSLPLNNSSVLVNDINANSLSNFGKGKSPSADLNWLDQDVAQYDHNFGKSLVAPPTTAAGTGENFSDPITVAAGDYLVLHYGAGPGGTRGGGAVGLYFGAAGIYDVPELGVGPNGHGGISYAELFGPGSNVPDGCSTALLLGCTLPVIGLIRRKLTR